MMFVSASYSLEPAATPSISAWAAAARHHRSPGGQALAELFRRAAEAI
jgi:hypothetical protein